MHRKKLLECSKISKHTHTYSSSSTVHSQSKLEFNEASYPFSSQMQLVICTESDGPQLLNSRRSWAVNRSSDAWWIMSIWFSRNISRFRSDSRILLNVVCTLAFAYSECTTCKTYTRIWNWCQLIKSSVTANLTSKGQVHIKTAFNG